MSTAPRAVLAQLPRAPGVYRFRDARGRALYIGRATDLRSRVGSYWSDLRDRRHLRRMVPQITGIEAVVCASVHESTWLERNLLERSRPRWNRAVGGAEVPVCIALTRVNGVPRLTVVHWPVAGPAAEVTFGPYLGGAKTRLAVSALDRVLPLRYTDDRLAGCQRDLARVRGIDLADREVLLTTILAVLHRQNPQIDAVRDQLADLRDRAAGRLAFELAARIQQEIEAIDWVVAEQRMTAPAGDDAEIHGWADGLLVSFRVRGGRVCGWEQRRCARADAQPYLDRTPAAWAEFAARSAELGGRLAQPGSMP
ncbi:GIY-YIG nuclease family protein [Paractinoplanes rishiriensis]|uniref:GIY-YIG domain-containing protein n=1 Tax=Paractinoplanes rishiriensis TaxID=1050105 RepID=A0A919JT94_9ACTN|nr:GIY-YIG nuclease family protein [Actinoplanes rishiriensis]GIE93265.1 hypothetical protein Ari01nite_07300 [Actinoplanes rishiriensis]